MFKALIKNMPLTSFLYAKLKQFSQPKKILLKGIGNIIKNAGFFNNVTIDIDGNNNSVFIGENTSVNNCLIYLRGDNHRIVIEPNCYIGGGELWLEDSNCTLIIHTNTTIEWAHLAVTESFSVIEIHEDCMLAKQVEIRTGDSHSILDLVTGKRINQAANVILEEHVWVGTNSKILKGVRVGHNSIIGTGAVVTKDIPANSIASGLPAKVLRVGVDWKRERLID